MIIEKQPCQKCKGEGGFINGFPSSEINSPAWVRCPKCQGARKLDWVEMVMGRRDIEDPVREFYRDIIEKDKDSWLRF
jgi:hypothetical protein